MSKLDELKAWVDSHTDPLPSPAEVAREADAIIALLLAVEACYDCEDAGCSTCDGTPLDDTEVAAQAA